MTVLLSFQRLIIVSHTTCHTADKECDDKKYSPIDSISKLSISADTPCPMKEDLTDKTKYFTSTHEQMMCPGGLVWNQAYCTCVSSMYYTCIKYLIDIKFLMFTILQLKLMCFANIFI